MLTSHYLVFKIHENASFNQFGICIADVHNCHPENAEKRRCPIVATKVSRLQTGVFNKFKSLIYFWNEILQLSSMFSQN